jgi:hypothetical protein
MFDAGSCDENPGQEIKISVFQQTRKLISKQNDVLIPVESGKCRRRRF